MFNFTFKFNKLLYKKIRALLAFFVLFFFINYNYCNSFRSNNEYIDDFKVEVIVNKDRTISIKEIITYVTTLPNKPIHGLARKFPIYYFDNYGNQVTILPKIKEILLDNQPVEYTKKKLFNGQVLYIGNPAIILNPGKHVYTIAYSLNRQIGFYDKYDELFFNIIGTYWQLPIYNVNASISLPDDIPEDKINFKAYMGAKGEFEQNYKSYKKDHTIYFKTTKVLRPFQGLSAVVIWPKGYIKPPSLLEKTIDIFQDNKYYIFLILGLITLLIYYLLIYFKRVKPQQQHKPVIPLFYPPDDLLPSQTRYIWQKKYDSKALASDIVNLAILGYLTIDYKKGWLSGGTYTLVKTEKEYDKAPLIYQKILKVLFNKSNRLDMSQRYSNGYNPLSRAYHLLESFLAIRLKHKYFKDYSKYSFIGILISLLFILPSLYFALNNVIISNIFIILLVILYLIIIYVFANIFQGYTSKGIEIKDSIDGFQLFLKTTEAERLKVMGVSFENMPELYERYLPYAIALNVEEQWSKKFVSIFKSLEKEGYSYKPQWYISNNMNFINALHLSNLTSNLSNNLANNITSASISNISPILAPGSRSGWQNGSGGTGFGGGGGGGSSW